MPKLGCNGFSLFAEQMRPSLEDLKGKKLAKFNDLISAAGPYWQTLPEEEKRDWKDRARHYKRSDTYHAKKKNQRMRGFDAKQRKLNGEECRGPMRSASFGSEGPTGRNSDMMPEEIDSQDPMELPGPVSRWRNRPHRPPSNYPFSPNKDMMMGSSVRLMDLVDGSPSMVVKALSRLGLAGPTGRLLPTARLLVPPPPCLPHTFPPPFLTLSDDDDSDCDDIAHPNLFAIPRPLCTCPRPQRPHIRKKRRSEMGLERTQSSSLNDADIETD